MMKTPEEYVDYAIDNLGHFEQPWYQHGVYDGSDKAILSAIKLAQIDAYNEALEDAAENVTTELTPTCIRVDKQSILKLKR